LVFGGEADVSLTGFSGTAGDSDANDTIDASVDTLSSLRARLGFANGPILAFLTGGIAYASGDFTINDNIGEFDENSGSGKIGAFGGVVGGGIEVAASRHVSMRVEGLYYFFDERIDTSDFTDDSDEGDYFGIDNTFVVRAALNFRL
jgi:opacity protein-like surface antigen